MNRPRSIDGWRAGLVGLLMVLGVSLAFGATAEARWSNHHLMYPTDGEPMASAITPAGDAFVAAVADDVIQVQELPAGYLNPKPQVTVSDPSEDSSSPSLDAADDGTLYAAWSVDQITERIQVGGITADGDAMPVDQIDLGGLALGNPVIAAAPGGGAVVLYSRSAGTDPTALYAVPISAEGVAGEPVQINDDEVFGSYFVEPDGEGGFHAFWNEDDAGTTSVRGTTLNADGTPGAVIGVTELTPPGSLAAVDVNEACEAGVVYTADSGGSFRLVEADGTVGEAKALPVAGVGFGFPQVGLDADGDAVASWIGIGAGGVGPKLSEIPSDGAPSEPVPANPEGVSVFNCVLAMTEDGRFTLGLYASLPDGYGVMAREGSFGGELTEPTLLTPPGSSAYTNIATLRAENGDSVAFWGDGGRFVARNAAALAADPVTVDFGSAEVGDRVYRQVKVTNDGGSPLEVGEVAVAGEAAGDFVVDLAGCTDLTLGQGASCGVVVRFTPTASGNRSAQLAIGSDGVRTASPIELSGIATTKPEPKAQISVKKVKPQRFALRKGRSRVIRVRVANSGTGSAKGVKVCASLNRAAKRKVKVRRCARLGSIGAKHAKVARFRVTARRGKRARGKAVIRFRATTTNANNARGRATIRVRR